MATWLCYAAAWLRCARGWVGDTMTYDHALLAKKD